MARKTKPGRGRPKTTGRGQMIGVRVHPPLLRRIDQHIKAKGKPRRSRPQAIREIVDEVLP